MFIKLITNEKAKNDFASRTFTDEQLRQFFETNVGGYEKWYLQYRKLWDDFKTKSIKWYPHLSVFIDDFTEKFLWHDQIEQYKIKQFTATKKGMQMLLPYVSRYAKNTVYVDLKIYEANMVQIRDILEKDFNLKESALDDFMEQQKMKFNDICYNEKYLFDRASLKTEITPDFEKCVISLNAEKEKYLKADDETELDEMKKYFASEQCAAREICSQNSLTAMNSLGDKLEPYIAWFRKSSGPNMLDDNENIKDELDLIMLDLIEKILMKHSRYSDLNIKCMIDYMMRTQSLDKIYSKDLLFDEDMLYVKVLPIVLKYKKLYPEFA